MERVKAFTLLEITVSLLLTAILVTLAYGVIGSFTTLAQRSNGLGGRMETLRELQLALVSDADRSKTLTVTEGGFAFNGRTGSTRYESTPAGLLRTTNTITDTFHVDVKGSRLYWMDKEVQASGEPIDRVSLIVASTGDTTEITVVQPYDAVTRRLLN